MTAELSRTAMYMALYRALETVERKRTPLFRDPFAERFLPAPLRVAVRAARVAMFHRWIAWYADVRAPGARTSAIARTRYIDEVVRTSVAGGITQVVILGAGFDCRAQRIDDLRACRVFEVDREAMQVFKRSRMRHPAVDACYVAVDFSRDDAFERLHEMGWNDRLPTLFVWEGVTNYLSEKAVTAVLTHVGKSAPGTAIVFTYIHRGVIDGSTHFTGAERIIRTVRALGEPWTFGLAPHEVRPFVGRFGMQLREDLGADDYRARYIREKALGYSFYRIAVAEVQTAT